MAKKRAFGTCDFLYLEVVEHLQISARNGFSFYHIFKKEIGSIGQEKNLWSMCQYLRSVQSGSSRTSSEIGDKRFFFLSLLLKKEQINWRKEELLAHVLISEINVGMILK